MSNSNILDTNGVHPRWQFVNMFSNFPDQVYYCRLKLFVPGMKKKDQIEITRSDATMQIAFDNANKAAKEWKLTEVSHMR